MWYLASVKSGKSSYQLRDTSNDHIIRAVDGASIVFNSKKRKEAFESIDTNGSTADKILSRVYAGTGVGATVVAGTASAAYLAQFAPALSGFLGTSTTKAYIAAEGWLSSVLGKVTAGYIMANPDVGLDVYNTWRDFINRNWGAMPMNALSFAYNSLDYNLYKYSKNKNYNIEQTQVQKDYNDYMNNRKIVNVEVDNSNASVIKPIKNNKKTVVEPVVSSNTGVGGAGIKTPKDLYAFGNSTSPRGARPVQDFDVEDFSNFVGPETPPMPHGASSFDNIDNVPLKGHYHTLPEGTELPEGLGVIADGSDVLENSLRGVGHHSFFPIKSMTVEEFNNLFKSLPWKYGGKK